MSAADYDTADTVAVIAARADADQRRLAVAESLTGGAVASALARGEGAGEWFRGGIVTYQPRVKFDVLDVAEGPVVNEATARQMARAAASMFDADLAVSLTGEAGPEPQEDVPPGTVWIGVCDGGVVDAMLYQFTGDPEDIVADAVRQALLVLADRLAWLSSMNSAENV